MSDTWVNAKGKKFTGADGTVPAADEKSAIIVDYAEQYTLAITITPGAAPSEADNDAPQEVTFTAVINTHDQTPVTSWSYPFNVTSVGAVPLTFSTITAIAGGISGKMIFPINVVAGAVGKMNVFSGGHTNTASVTVVA